MRVNPSEVKFRLRGRRPRDEPERRRVLVTVAQLDRASAGEAESCGFKSRRPPIRKRPDLVVIRFLMSAEYRSSRRRANSDEFGLEGRYGGQ